MKRPKRTFTQAEKELVFDLWKQGTGFSDIGKVLNAAPGTVFTALRQSGGIKPEPRKRNACCDSMIPDTILGGIIITQLEVFNDKKTSYFFSRV